MRNLKRALSLALASVMTLGMMTVGASAKGLDDFSDAAKIVNADAVAVTSHLGIFKGYDDGEFKGENVVTRAQMAVICAKLLYGADVDPAQFQGINNFTDVPAWAEGYVNLCASLGIIVGRDAKTFDPDATVSTVEASVMLAKTLGYFKNEKDFGSDWKLATTAKATQLGLYGDLKLAADAGLTRDSVAELVFNTMTKAVPVQYNELLGVYYNDNQGIIYALEFNYLETLGYKNFDLVYRVTDEFQFGDDTDYGRPAVIWGTGSYDYNKAATDDSTAAGTVDANGGLFSNRVNMLDRDEIITIYQTPDYTYYEGTDEDAVIKDLGANVCNTYNWNYYVNGTLVDSGAGPQKDNDTTAWEYTKKGAVTEIYIDKANETVTLCEINYFLGEVSSVKENDEGEYANIKTLSRMDNLKLNDKKFYTSELEAEDLVVYTVDHRELENEYYIQELYLPATITGEVSRVEDKNNSDKTYIRMVGETGKFEYASPEHMVYDLADLEKNNHPDLNEDYILYMTPAGYVLGYEKVDETVDQYLYVKDSDEELKDWIAKVILTDASTVKVDVNGKVKKAPAAFSSATTGDEIIEWLTGYNGTNAKLDSNIDKRVWKYSVNDKGVYTLTYVDYEHKTNMEINNDEAYISGPTDSQDVLVNSKTVFVDVDGGKAYVGHKNVPNIDNAEIAYVTNDKKVAIVVFVLDGDIYDKDATYFFLADDDRESLKYDGDYYYEYFEAYDVEGEKFTLTVGYDAYKNGADELEPGYIYQVKKTVDEIYVTEVVDATATFGSVVAAGEDTFRIREVAGDTINTLKFDTDEDTKFVLVEDVYKKDGSLKGYDVSKGDLDDMIEGVNDECMTSTVYVVKADKQTAELVYIHNYVTEAPVTAQLSDYVTEIEIAGMTNGTAKLGDELLLKLDVAKFKAALDSSKVYSVVINGTAYDAYAIGGYLYVEYIVDAEALENGNGVELKIGAIVETNKTAYASDKPAIPASFQAPTQYKADGTVMYNIYITGVCYDNGYSEYSVASDAVTLEVTLKADEKTVDYLTIKAVDPTKVNFGAANVKVYYNETLVTVDADGKVNI